MRVKQTARKSTTGGVAARLSVPVKEEPHSSGSSSDDSSSERGNSSRGSSFSVKPDPLKKRLTQLLDTKRKSLTPRDKNSVKIRPRFRPGELVLSEIKRLQNSHDLQIPRAAFHRVVREVTQDIMSNREDQRVLYQAAALQALQEAAESYLTRLFEDSYMLTLHAKRVTLFPQDIQLCRRLQANAQSF